MSNQKKVVVSTFNNSQSNYGAVFQACALSQELISMGYDVTYISLENRVNQAAPKGLKGKLKNMAAGLLSLPTAQKRKNRAAKFRSFVERTQKLAKYDSYDELLQNPPEADVYLSGSDQVWNVTNMHEELLLSFAPDGKRRISYAASMGNETVPEQNREKFADYIRRYDAVSVREDTMLSIIQPLTDHPVFQHIDPVFLKPADEWKKIEKPYKALKYNRYILLYAIEWDKDSDARLEALKKALHIPVVSVTLSGWNRSCADQAIYDASPEEFLYLMHHAVMAVASSFHGTAMAIIYQKPFLTVPGKGKPTRIESLLRHFDLNSHNTTDFSWEKAMFDYQKTEEQIAEDRKAAELFLREAIEETG